MVNADEFKQKRYFFQVKSINRIIDQQLQVLYSTVFSLCHNDKFIVGVLNQLAECDQQFHRRVSGPLGNVQELIAPDLQLQQQTADLLGLGIDINARLPVSVLFQRRRDAIGLALALGPGFQRLEKIKVLVGVRQDNVPLLPGGSRLQQRKHRLGHVEGCHGQGKAGNDQQSKQEDSRCHDAGRLEEESISSSGILDAL